MLAHSNRTIGLLGGSFNPAHQGHIDISLEAYKKLGLDEIWWLVSPQNPLKSSDNLAPLEQRVDHAQTLTKHHRFIHISDIEKNWNSLYSTDSINRLQASFPQHQFVWLMGADNLAHFHHWHRWKDIFHQLPIAVFARQPLQHKALRSPAAHCFSKQRLTSNFAMLPHMATPSWAFIHQRINALSSAALRNQTSLD